MARHPICDDLVIPLPTTEAIEEMAADMRENGWDRKGGPSYWFQKRCLVGNTREAAAKIAKVKPYRKLFKGDAAAAREFVYRMEIQRRQLTPEQSRQSRDARIGQLREEGKSIRQIAESVDTAPSTVAATVQRLHSSPADGQVVGEDGKKRAAQAKPQARCGKCSRAFPHTNASVKGCVACAEAKKLARKRQEPGLERRRSSGRAKGGKAAFDWRPLHDGFGQTLRQVDTFGSLYGVKDSKDAEKLRELLKDWKVKFVEWTQKVSQTPAKTA